MNKVFVIPADKNAKNAHKEKSTHNFTGTLKEKKAQIERKSVIQDQKSINDSFIIRLDFTNKKELLENMRQIADKNCRTVSGQILFLTEQYCLDFIFDKVKK